MLINKYGTYLRKEFGSSVYKITVDAGFTCPNRDGTKGFGGCTYCNNEKFFQIDKYSGKSPRDQVLEKIQKRKLQNLNKCAEKYIVYFQTYTNTYSDSETLKQLYESVLNIENVIGIAIGTRVDCISDEILSMLSEISKKYYVCLEYGLESISNQTLERINRGHDVECFIDAVFKTHKHGIDICAHLIFGFPWEERIVAKKTADFINELPIKFVKIHQLQVVKNSIMANEYRNNPFPLLSKIEYLNYLSDFLSQLNPCCIVQRVAGDCPSDILIGTGFTENSHKIMSDLEKMMNSMGLTQGINLRSKCEVS